MCRDGWSRKSMLSAWDRNVLGPRYLIVADVVVLRGRRYVVAGQL